MDKRERTTLYYHSVEKDVKGVRAFVDTVFYEYIDDIDQATLTVKPVDGGFDIIILQEFDF